VIYSYHPPLTTALSAMLVGFFKRRPFVVDIQDLWPDTLAAKGMLSNQKVLNIVGWVCKIVYRRSARIKRNSVNNNPINYFFLVKFYLIAIINFAAWIIRITGNYFNLVSFFLKLFGE